MLACYSIHKTNLLVTLWPIENIVMNKTKNEIVVYQPDETIRLEVRLEDETVWLTQSQMGMLFGCTIYRISIASFGQGDSIIFIFQFQDVLFQ